MKNKIILGLCFFGLCAWGAWMLYQQRANAGTPNGHRAPSQLVFVGDTQERVYELLGDPKIEFPGDGVMVRWYAGYEVTTSNDVVIAVEMKPVETEAEREEKELRAEMAEARLRDSYQVLAEKEKISYDAWREREEQRLRQERLEQAKIEAYERRRSAEKKAAIYADAIKKSCGCTHRYCGH